MKKYAMKHEIENIPNQKPKLFFWNSAKKNEKLKGKHI